MLWHDRYQPPSLDALLAGMDDAGRSIARRALDRLDRRPRPVWVETWHWALAVEHATGTVYLVPREHGPLLVARVSRARFEGAGEHTLPRAARDAVRNASCAGDAVWVEWEVTSDASLDAILGVLETP